MASLFFYMCAFYFLIIFAYIFIHNLTPHFIQPFFQNTFPSWGHNFCTCIAIFIFYKIFKFFMFFTILANLCCINIYKIYHIYTHPLFFEQFCYICRFEPFVSVLDNAYPCNNHNIDKRRHKLTS